jgi:hypothetical protein
MTHAELLVDLAARDGIRELVGIPVDVTPSGDVGVVAWYDQSVWERDEKVGLKKSIRYYVLDEGGPGEDAYYKDAEPQTLPSVTPNALHSWMRDIIDADPDDYKGVQVHYVSERWLMVVFSVLEDDGASGLEWQTYYIRKGAGAPVKISNHDPSYLQSLFRV